MEAIFQPKQAFLYIKRGYWVLLTLDHHNKMLLVFIIKLRLLTGIKNIKANDRDQNRQPFFCQRYECVVQAAPLFSALFYHLV